MIAFLCSSVLQEEPVLYICSQEGGFWGLILFPLAHVVLISSIFTLVLDSRYTYDILCSELSKIFLRIHPIGPTIPGSKRQTLPSVTHLSGLDPIFRVLSQDRESISPGAALAENSPLCTIAPKSESRSLSLQPNLLVKLYWNFLKQYPLPQNSSRPLCHGPRQGVVFFT